MRVLAVSAAMGAGGAEVVADVLVRHLTAHGHDVVLASGGGFRADALTRDGLHHVTVPLLGHRPADLVRAVGGLRRTARCHGPDVVHAHNVKATALARLAVGPRVPVVTTMHGVPAAQARAAGRILRACATHVVAVSQHVADILLAHGVPADRVSVVENAIAPVRVTQRAAARRSLDIAPERPVALVLARLAPQKRHDLLLEAWPTVPGDALLLVAGDGSTRDAVEARAAASPAANRIRLLGERTDVDVLLGATDLLILPTDWEGLPISLLEALGAGVPAVVSDVGGVGALGDAVRLVRAGSAPALGEAVADLLNDPAARARLADRGRGVVRTRFDPAVMQQIYTDRLAHEARLARTPRPLVRPQEGRP